MLMKGYWERARDLGSGIPGQGPREVGCREDRGLEEGKGPIGPVRKEVASAPREELNRQEPSVQSSSWNGVSSDRSSLHMSRGVTCLPCAQAQVPLVFMRRGTLSCPHQAPLRAGAVPVLPGGAPPHPAPRSQRRTMAVGAAVPAAVFAVLAEQAGAP